MTSQEDVPLLDTTRVTFQSYHTTETSGRTKSVASLLVSRTVPSLLAVLTFIYLLLPFQSQAYPEMFQDDFFYYALTARHILAGHGSTFDGSHMTNGYHPLWMVVVLAVTAIFHAGVPFYAAFCVIIAAAVFLTYALLVAVFHNYTGPVTSQCLAAFFALNFLALNGGMEVTLTVPLLCLLVFFRLQRFDWTRGGRPCCWAYCPQPLCCPVSILCFLSPASLYLTYFYLPILLGGSGSRPFLLSFWA